MAQQSNVTGTVIGKPPSHDKAQSNDYRYRLLDEINNLQSLPLQALLLIAGNNATLFLSNIQPDGHRDKRHEPVDLPSLQHHFTSQRILTLYKRYQDRPKLCVNGTSSDAALPTDVDQWLNRLAPRLVREGVGHICGGAVTGAMGAAIKAFVSAIRDINTADIRADLKDRPEVATVLLKLLGAAADREKPQDLMNWGLSSVKQWSWMTRTPALHGIGEQNVMAFLPGGWGTLFEVFYPLAARQFASKGIVGIFDEYRRPSEFVFVSSSSYDDGHFWSGTEALLKEMVDTGACKREFSRVTMFQPHEGEDAIDAIVEHYRNAQHTKKPRAKFDSPTTQFAMGALEKLTKCGLEPRDTTDRVSRPFFALLDNIVASHMTLYHLRNSIEIFQKGDHTGALEYQSKALKGVGDARDGVLETLERLSTRPAVQLIGSTKDHFWTPSVEKYSHEVIKQAVATGASVVLSGSGTEGLSKQWTDIWVQEKRAFVEATGSESQSELVRVQASYTGQEVPQRQFLHGYTETLLPTVLTLDTRNELANAIGSKQAFVLAPGGHAEVLAFVQAALNNQLFGKMYTPYVAAPVFHVLNVAGSGGDGFYTPLIRQLSAMEKYKTIRSTEYSKDWFTDLSSPVEDAERLFDKLVSVSAPEKS